MKYIGAHVSASGGVDNAPKNAKAIGATAFAMFVKNQRQWVAKELTQKTIDAFKKNLKEINISPKHILPHDGYLINLANPDLTKNKKSFSSFVNEINRCNQLGLDKINFHPGNHLVKFNKSTTEYEKKKAEEIGLKRIAKNMNKAISETDNISLVIENTAGQGSVLGYKFEHLAFLINEVKDKSRVGVCIDTCHMFSAGYDIRDKKSYDKTFSEFEKIVGFEYLKGMHLNDSKVKLGSKVDRHHSLGKGEIGINAFKFIMQDPRMDDIPLILETIDSSIWGKEIEMLNKFSRPPAADR
ncbi:MAG: deoxyribonuclease IV [Candidatus Marinimicrobia bacterium]|nr:deoxyribonuclease IV [Candidatus Neomarinimicrobiota bacterium]